MAVYLDTAKFLDAVCLMLRQGQKNVPIPVAGTSMRPFLGSGDTAYLTSLEGPVRPGDVLLFQRENGQYVLHRLMKIRGDTLWFLGDSQLQQESVQRHQLRAKVASVRRRGEALGPGSFVWWFYACPWRWLAPWRAQISKLREWLRQHIR